MKELREKKIKLMKKCDHILNPINNNQSENYEELLLKQHEVTEENKQLLEELSEITADLEIKELKIKNLQKKILEMAAIFQSENEIETENQEIRLKISQQQEKIKSLKQQLKGEEKIKEEITSRACSNCLIF